MITIISSGGFGGGYVGGPPICLGNFSPASCPFSHKTCTVHCVHFEISDYGANTLSSAPLSKFQGFLQHHFQNFRVFPDYY